MWTWQKHPTAVHSPSRNSQLSQGDVEAEMQVKTRSAERVCVQSGAYGTSPPKWHWVKEPRQVSEWFRSRWHLLPFLAKIDVEEISDHAFTLTFGLRALGIDGEHRWIFGNFEKQRPFWSSNPFGPPPTCSVPVGYQLETIEGQSREVQRWMSSNGFQGPFSEGFLWISDPPCSWETAKIQNPMCWAVALQGGKSDYVECPIRQITSMSTISLTSTQHISSLQDLQVSKFMIIQLNQNWFQADSISMHGIFPHIYSKNQPNVGKSPGRWLEWERQERQTTLANSPLVAERQELWRLRQIVGASYGHPGIWSFLKIDNNMYLFSRNVLVPW